MNEPMLTLSAQGLFSPAGHFHIDPSRAVENAVITHAHSDHARPGNGHYLAHHDSAGILRRMQSATIAATCSGRRNTSTMSTRSPGASASGT